MPNTHKHAALPHVVAGTGPEVVAAAGAVIYRQVSIALAAFDRLKHWQRYIARKEGQTLTNGETISRLLLTLPEPPTPDTRRRRA